MQINTKTSRKRRLFRGDGGAPFPPTIGVASVPVANATYAIIPNAYASGVAAPPPPGCASQIPVVTAKCTTSVLPAISATAHYPNAVAANPVSAQLFPGAAQYSNAVSGAYVAPGHPACSPTSAGAWHWHDENGGWIPYDAKCSGLIESVRSVSERSGNAVDSSVNCFERHR